MGKIEEELNRERNKINNLEAPLEMENRLRAALNSKKSRRVPFKWLSVAASILLVLFVGLNYNALAYYGKKIAGFDEVVYGSLKEVNELGMGQVIGKTTEINETTTLTIDGVVADENQLIVYYTVTSAEKLDKEYLHFFPRKMTGFLTNKYSTWSTGLLNEKGTEMKGVASFDPPNMFAKTLTLEYRLGLSTGEVVEGDISVPFNPKEAIQSVVKQKINQKVAVDNGNIHFDSITASPLSTVVNGTIDVDNYSRSRGSLTGVKLLADGEPIPQAGGSESSTFNGKRKIEIRYEGLPEDFTSLHLLVDTFVGYKQVGAEIDLPSLKGEVIDLHGEELWIRDVSFKEDQVEITIASEDTFLLDGVSVGTGSGVEKTPLLTTTNHTETKLEDGTIHRVRTMVFPTSAEVTKLYIEGVHYEKRYNKSITIPVK